MGLKSEALRNWVSGQKRLEEEKEEKEKLRQEQLAEKKEGRNI